MMILPELVSQANYVMLELTYVYLDEFLNLYLSDDEEDSYSNPETVDQSTSYQPKKAHSIQSPFINKIASTCNPFKDIALKVAETALQSESGSSKKFTKVDDVLEDVSENSVIQTNNLSSKSIPNDIPATASVLIRSSDERVELISQLSNTSTATSSVFEESFKHSLTCGQNYRRLSCLNNISRNGRNTELLHELNLVDLRTLTKNEKKSLRSKNEKYYINFNKLQFSTHGKHFGEDWEAAHKRMVHADWARLKFLANPPPKTVPMTSSVVNAPTTKNT